VPTRRAPSAERRIEFGDFQTPQQLAQDVCSLVSAYGLAPSSIVEPTCGVGNFLFAALNHFSTAKRALAVEVNAAHVSVVTGRLNGNSYQAQVDVIRDSFFLTDWSSLLEELPDPVLVIGNPPWVTNAELSSLESSNLPAKSNFQGHRGFDARTGKSNFDISEWMLIHLLEWLGSRNAMLAMLCKTAVARKALVHHWKAGRGPSSADLYRIDAQNHFGAAVDASLLVCRFYQKQTSRECAVYPSLVKQGVPSVIGFRDGMLVADLALYERWKHLAGREIYRWRSGIKHDCSKVLELRSEGDKYRNGLGELIELEPDYLFPMLKSSEIASGDAASPKSWMLVTQQTLGEDTNKIATAAPKTWNYLISHAKKFSQRGSSIYKGRPQFSMFGVGEYSFSPWKVGISGLYKKLQFTVVGRVAGKPVVLDDTCYFIGCESKEEADFLAKLLNSRIAREFYGAFVFWDSKRPITVDLLRRLDFISLAEAEGCEQVLRRFLAEPLNASRFLKTAT
jgi:hypothetical protein